MHNHREHLLLSIQREIEAKIKDVEGIFAHGVLADFKEQREIADDELRLMLKWGKMYGLIPKVVATNA